MRSRRVDKVTKDVERTGNPGGLQVGQTPPDNSGVPQLQSSLGIHVTGEAWFGENATESVSCKQLTIIQRQCKLSEQQVNSIPSLLLLFSVAEGSRRKRAAEKGNDSGRPGLCFLIKMLFHQQEWKQSPQDTTKRLPYCGQRVFEESNLKFADVINSVCVCSDVPRDAFGCEFL